MPFAAPTTVRCQDHVRSRRRHRPRRRAGSRRRDRRLPPAGVPATAWRSPSASGPVGVPYRTVDIWKDPDAAAFVRRHARGHETVPTVVVGDTVLVNPSARQVIAHLEAPKVRPMARATVTGYCWPQSVAPGETVGLHLSSSGERIVSGRGGPGGLRRTVVLADDVPAGDHPTPPGADRGRVRLARRRRPSTSATTGRRATTRSLLEIDDDGKRRREPRLLRRPPRIERTSANGSSSPWPPTPGTPTTTSAGTTSTPAAPTVSLQRPMTPRLPVQAAGPRADG